MRTARLSLVALAVTVTTTRAQLSTLSRRTLQDDAPPDRRPENEVADNGSSSVLDAVSRAAEEGVKKGHRIRDQDGRSSFRASIVRGQTPRAGSSIGGAFRGQTLRPGSGFTGGASSSTSSGGRFLQNNVPLPDSSFDGHGRVESRTDAGLLSMSMPTAVRMPMDGMSMSMPSSKADNILSENEATMGEEEEEECSIESLAGKFAIDFDFYSSQSESYAFSRRAALTFSRPQGPGTGSMKVRYSYSYHNNGLENNDAICSENAMVAVQSASEKDGVFPLVIVMYDPEPEDVYDGYFFTGQYDCDAKALELGLTGYFNGNGFFTKQPAIKDEDLKLDSDGCLIATPSNELDDEQECEGCMEKNDWSGGWGPWQSSAMGKRSKTWSKTSKSAGRSPTMSKSSKLSGGSKSTKSSNSTSTKGGTKSSKSSTQSPGSSKAGKTGKSGRPEEPSSQPSTEQNPSGQPSSLPSTLPSSLPSEHPSGQPSSNPSVQPSSQPSEVPSGQPSSQPSDHPSGQLSAMPSSHPSSHPSGQPSSQPSTLPSSQPSGQPSGPPSSQPSGQPINADKCQITATAPGYSDCASQGENGPCCIQGVGLNFFLECRNNCASCQQGPSSDDCCSSVCQGTATPVCCKVKNGNKFQFKCVASLGSCPAGVDGTSPTTAPTPVCIQPGDTCNNAPCCDAQQCGTSPPKCPPLIN